MDRVVILSSGEASPRDLTSAADYDVVDENTALHAAEWVISAESWLLPS
ncbi:MAG TPA: hypothetical protein VGG04_18840 [Candidatus Sulfotelmatobacter sp.]